SSRIFTTCGNVSSKRPRTGAMPCASAHSALIAASTFVRARIVFWNIAYSSSAVTPGVSKFRRLRRAVVLGQRVVHVAPAGSRPRRQLPEVGRIAIGQPLDGSTHARTDLFLGAKYVLGRDRVLEAGVGRMRHASRGC